MDFSFASLNWLAILASVIAGQAIRSIMQLVTFIKIAMLTLVVTLALPSRVLANDALEELKDCARIGDDSVRIACYEELGSRVLNETAAENNANDTVSADDLGAAPVAAPTSGDTLADDLGGDEFAKKAEDHNEANRGRIASCRQGPDKKWNFFFENGQIWKQSDGRRYRFRECDFYVTITKDRFGYKMQIDDGKGKIRIRRKR